MKITLQNVKRKFDQWRTTKKTKKEEIPEALLMLASACAFKYGPSLTSRTLHLGYSKLRSAMDTYSSDGKVKNLNLPEKISSNKNKPSFEVEFIEARLRQPDSTREGFPPHQRKTHREQPALYELENRCGLKMRIFSDSPHLYQSILSSLLMGG